ncbi:hypothetical protein NC653_011551 [Populus alba x Populus x berolinensis]|uniref:Uncharacterized protein n=1 Tax=Populus alba x Populus x berolinensis TaxID=444605 RepID=A0AAD6W731_9ROSI|nr:hypothetical protein NC653_011551 [Populus alba x Populus x berolinensis]
MVGQATKMCIFWYIIMDLISLSGRYS